MPEPNPDEHVDPLYIPLDLELNQIRVLTLEPHPRPDVLQCRMEVVSLDDVTDDYREYEATLPETRRGIPIFDTWLDFIDDRYKYTGIAALETRPETFRYTWGDFIALSYEWGDPLPTAEMILNGQTVQIRANLASALQILSTNYGSGGPKLWADAVSINQSDNQELSREVKRLGNLFAKAWRTLIWLGPERDDSAKAFELLQKLADCSDDAELVRLLSPGSAYVGTGHFRAIYHLLRRSYWDRLWVLQELILSHEKTRILCGPSTTSMHTLLRACQEMTRDVDLFSRLIANERIAANELQRGSHIGWSWTAIRLETVPNLREDAILDPIEMIMQLMEHSHTSMQARLHDKVYGLLGVLPPVVTSQIVPDVNATAQEVYRDFSCAVLRGTGVLLPFSGDNVLARCSPTWLLNLACAPSDFIYPLRRRPVFRASGATKIDPAISQGGKLLTCKAYILDVIVAANSPYSRLTTSQVPQTHSIMSSWQLDASIDAVDLLWLTLLAGCDFSEEPLVEVPECLRTMPWFGDTAFETLVEQDWLYNYDSSLFNFFREFCEENGQTMVADQLFSSYFAGETTRCMDAVASRQSLERVVSVADGRKLMVTQNACLGLCPKSAQIGDVVAVQLGCRTPVILRSCSADGTFKLLGDCYFYGLMEGEVVDGALKDKFELPDITIC